MEFISWNYGKNKVKKVQLHIIIIISLFSILYVFYGFITYDGMEKIDKNFCYATESLAIVGKDNLIDVPPYVKFYCYDKFFVLVKQRPHYFYDDIFEYNENYEYKHGLNTDYYWIIIKKEKRVVGPLTEEEFYKNIEALNISEKLINKFREKCINQ